MFNILVPLAGKGTFKIEKNSVYPKILHDIDGRLLLERAAEPYVSLDAPKKIVIAAPKDEIVGFQFKSVLELLGDCVEVCHVNADTQGAVCSAMLAIDSIDLDQPLIITSFEQVLNVNIKPFVDQFLDMGVDSGVLTFDAIHPKWSYVKLGKDGLVVQAAEKMPISRHAVAGFYYFKTAGLFFEAAKEMIRKNVTVNGSYFVSHTLNEIILREGKVAALPIDKKDYFHINDERSLESYEESVLAKAKFHVEKIKKLTRRYISAFNERDIASVEECLSPRFRLTDPAGTFVGRVAVIEYISQIFDSVSTLEFVARQILVQENVSLIEFDLKINEKHLVGTDVIEWGEDNKMVSMDAYLYEVAK